LPWDRPGRFRDVVEEQLYSFFNLGAIWVWVVNATPRPLYALETNPVPIIYKNAWGSKPVWTCRKNLPPGV
jgi:hypothetical protein